MLRVSVLAFALLSTGRTHAQLVWFHTPTGPVTHVIRGERSVRHYQGIRIAVEGVPVRIRVETVRAKAWDCQWDPVNPYETTEVETDRWNVARRLLAVRGGRAEVLLDATEIEFNTAIDDRIRPIASLGPYLLVRRTYYAAGACGMHGLEYTSWTWFDLRDGSRIEIEPSVSARSQLPGLERRLRSSLMLAVLSSTGDRAEAVDLAGREGPLTVVGIEPRLRQGRFRARVHVEFGVPYAWGGPDYAMHAHIDTDDLSDARLERFRSVPANVRRFLGARPSWKLGGVSRVR